MDGRIDVLIANIEQARTAVVDAESALAAFRALPENNVFASMEVAESTLEDRLMSMARNDCEGAYNCGDDEYTQEFVVDGKHYMAKLECEYNRHDKTYYYVDGSEFSVKPVATP